MHATGRQKCNMIMIWCNCWFCLKKSQLHVNYTYPHTFPFLCPRVKLLVMFTCKIHFIRSPGAIIAVVQTPAKNPEVRIWKYLSKKLIHYIIILYYYAYYAFHEKWTCNVDGKNKQKCSFEEETIKYHMYGWMDESPHCGYLRPINASDKNSTAQPLLYFLMKKRLLLLTS